MTQDTKPTTDGLIAGNGLADPKPGKQPRRVSRVLLSLLAPGLGHAAIGHWKRGAFWLVIYLTAFATLCLLALPGMPWLMWAALGCFLLLYLFVIPRDATRLQPLGLPRRRYVVALAVGAVISVSFIVGRVRTNLVEAFALPSGSMYPTIVRGDHVMTSKFPLTFERGDVVVFRYPHDPKISYVKRVAAVGGDIIELRGSRLIVNGLPVPTEPTNAACSTSVAGPACTLWKETLGNHSYHVARHLSDDFGPRRVAAGTYFVLGDNRDNSNDSRFWGSVPEALMIAKVKFIHWSSDEKGIRWDRINTTVE